MLNIVTTCITVPNEVAKGIWTDGNTEVAHKLQTELVNKLADKLLKSHIVKFDIMQPLTYDSYDQTVVYRARVTVES